MASVASALRHAARGSALAAPRLIAAPPRLPAQTQALGLHAWRGLCTVRPPPSARAAGRGARPDGAGGALQALPEGGSEAAPRREGARGVVRRDRYAHLARKDEEEENVLATRILAVDATRKTTKAGRTNSFRAMVAVGNMKGAAGFSIGKGKTVREAVQKAYRRASNTKQWVPVDLTEDNGIFYDVIGTHNNTKVLLRSCRPYKGLTAGPVVEALCQVTGIETCTTKIIGRTTTSSVVYAFFDALGKMYSPEELSVIRGLKVTQISRFRHN